MQTIGDYFFERFYFQMNTPNKKLHAQLIQTHACLWECFFARESTQCLVSCCIHLITCSLCCIYSGTLLYTHIQYLLMCCRASSRAKRLTLLSITDLCLFFSSSCSNSHCTTASSSCH